MDPGVTTGAAGFLAGEADPATTVTPDDLGEEERLLVRSVQEFAEREVRPGMERLLARDPETTRALFRKAAELGLFMAEVPSDDGGLDLDVLAVTAMLSTRARLGPLGPMIAGHQGIGTLPIVYFGTPDQKARYLPGCMDGTLLSAFALTEPGSGSDAMNIRTRAALDPAGGHYVLNGSKQWITNAAWADLFVLFAKVDGQQFTAFLVDRDTPGLAVGEPERLLGQHGSSVCALTLENVRVPAANVLGEVGRGYKVAFSTLNMGRLKLAASSATGAKQALEAAATYAGERVQFGVPIARFGLIRRKLADMAVRAYAADSVAYRTAGMVYHALQGLRGRGPVPTRERLDALSEFSAECALAKVYATEAYCALADEAIQVFGGYGFSEEYPPARMYRDSRVTRIYEGTNEICRLHAQRTLLKKLAGGGPEVRAAEGVAEALSRLRAGAGRQGPGAVEPGGPGAASGFRLAYFTLLEDVLGTAGAETLKSPDGQQLLASLADVAMEAFAAESVAARVAKLGGSGTEEARAVRADLAALTLERSAERVRSEARTVLGEIHPGSEGASRLAGVDALLPPPAPLVEARARVAAWLVARRGLLPGEAE